MSLDWRRIYGKTVVGISSAVALGALAGSVVLLATPEGARSQPPTNEAPPDAIAEAQTPKEAPVERPEQKKTAHDLSDVFNPSNAVPSSEALTNQQDRGEMRGFDFYRDPLGAMRPGMTFEDFYKAGVANKAEVRATQRRLLESRYNLEPKLDPVVKMSRGKPIAVGPTARLPAGMTWEALAQLSPAEIRERDIFPYKALPHAAQGGGLGGQVFPQMQIKMFPRLERYDVEFDLPEAFLPEFPPAMFLQNRPELGDVSRGEVVSINNYYRLFKDILTAVQLDGLRLLVTPFPQEEFNPTDDRKTVQPSLESKRGNRYLRVLFVQAAWVVLIRPKSWERYGLKPWIEAAKKRLHRNVLAIALANKLAVTR